MALSEFNAVIADDDAYDLNHLEATHVSIYFQAVALLSLGCTLKRIRPEEIDFDVYRNDAPV